MAISTAQYILDNVVATEICGPDIQMQRVTVHNLETGTGKMVYIGNSGVTTTNSLEMNPQVFFQFVIDPGDSLYAVSNTAGHKVGVLRQKQD
jgi:hypothetical protein